MCVHMCMHVNVRVYVCAWVHMCVSLWIHVGVTQTDPASGRCDCEIPYKRDYILQKRPIILRSLLNSVQSWCVYTIEKMHAHVSVCSYVCVCVCICMRICEHTYKLHPHSASSYRNSTRSERFGCAHRMCDMCVYVCYSGNAGWRRCIGRLNL